MAESTRILREILKLLSSFCIWNETFIKRLPFSENGIDHKNIIYRLPQFLCSKKLNKHKKKIKNIFMFLLSSFWEVILLTLITFYANCLVQNVNLSMY